MAAPGSIVGDRRRTPRPWAIAIAPNPAPDRPMPA
jgi:hypothetical protein